MTTARAKFRVESIEKFAGGGGSVKLWPVYSDDPNSENRRFWEATPSGSIEMSIKSEALDLFVLGEEYYVDFSPAIS